MAENTKIEWSDHTFNPWWGCTKVSSACDHCYAEAWARRIGFNLWGHRNSRRFLSEEYWRQPLRWDAHAKERGTRMRVFSASMADVFEWGKDLSEWRTKLWTLIEATPNLDWLLLTKRPHLIRKLSPWNGNWPHNVWLGTTVESQRWLEKRVPYLLENYAPVRFLSCEPLLSKLNLENAIGNEQINWVIAGGESGPAARPSDPEWIRSIRDQCIENNIAFHFKQWGEWAPIDQFAEIVPKTVVDEGEYSTRMGRFGKRVAGRILDDCTWDGIPNVEYSTQGMQLR